MRPEQQPERKPVLFLHSEVQDPYKIYQEMLTCDPVFYDQKNKLWAVYTYDYCKEVLGNPYSHIPSLNTDGFNDYALAITGKLPRFSNPPSHAVVRQIAMAVFQCREPVPVAGILTDLLPLPQKGISGEIDWIELVAKRLPVLSILYSFDFTPSDSQFIADRIGRMITFTQPDKTEEQVKEINAVSKEIYQRVEWHICYSGSIGRLIDKLAAETQLSREEVTRCCISNLIGLLTQSYDACRGLLGNTLYHFLLNDNTLRKLSSKSSEIPGFVREVLRYDPPVHHTRRILSENFMLGNIKITKNEQILVILAAANRDEKQFARPNAFDTKRDNNADHLSFGSGYHACLANDFASQMASETLSCLSALYHSITILTPDREYEALTNVRLVKKMIISLR